MVFASVFQDTENYHLVKENGMIAYTMQEDYGYKALNVLSASREYPYKKGFYKKIQTPMIKEPINAGESSRKLRRTLWIIRNAKKVDVLNLWFANRWTYFNIFFFGILNRHGLVYVHCDTTETILTVRESTNPVIVCIKHMMLTKKILRRVLWGVQGKTAAQKLDRWPFLNVSHIPNGFWWENDEKIKYDDKENVILFVGRIGTTPKNNEVLVEAFGKVAEKHRDWKLRMVGTVEVAFKKYMERFYKRYPTMKERIEFAGPIEDREELRQEYAKAKIFALTSRFEGYAIVKVEALSQGCYFVSTDIPSSRDTFDYGVALGELFPVGDAEALAKILDKNMADESVMRKQCPVAQKFAHDHFLYLEALRPLHEWIGDQKERHVV